MNPTPKTGLTQNARKIINQNVLYASGAGLIPFPLLDFATIFAIQVAMVKALANEYGLSKEEYNKSQVKSIIGSLVGHVSTVSLIKVIPGLGHLLGGTIGAVSGAASTYALGRVFAVHFSSGGTILDLNPEKIRSFYEQEYEKGKQLQDQMEREAEQNTRTKIDSKELEDYLEKLDPSNKKDFLSDT